MTRLLYAAALAPILAGPLGAQSEDALKRFFEGKSVVAKIDLPATKDGVDIYPAAGTPLDYSRYAARLKQAGTAVRAGESIMVTKVRVKEQHIEFQLGGGGYGTFGDDAGTSAYVPSAAKTTREKNLEKDVKTEADPAQKRRMQEELDRLRREREREDARNRAAAAAAEEAKKANLRQRATEAGSRFNVRFQVPVGAAQLTPESVMEALAKYVDFPAAHFGEASGSRTVEAPAVQVAATAAAPAGAGLGGLRKGASREEVEATFGKPVSTSERMEGRLKVLTCVFDAPLGRIEAQFVEGVLINYAIKSR